tara:strand:+ start:389 stop:862 length:474 start_codon:yes stop_codon:yes gene_type:complete
MKASKWILMMLTPLFIIILNMQAILIALLIIIFIDLLTGIRRALYENKVNFRPWKKKFWKVIKSHALRKTLRKTTEYIFGVIAFIIVEGLVFKGLKISAMGYEYAIAELAATIFCLVEVYSIYENMEAVSGNNIFKRFLSILPRKTKNIFKNVESNK